MATTTTTTTTTAPVADGASARQAVRRTIPAPLELHEPPATTSRGDFEPRTLTKVLPTAKQSDRRLSLDVLRLTSVVAVIFFHMHVPGTIYFSWRMPLLVAILTFLAAGGTRSTPPSKSLAKVASVRARRILVPWAIWSAIYLPVVGFYTYRGYGPEVLEWWMVLTGPAIHLWFVPFAFVASMLAFLVSRGLGRSGMGAIGLYLIGSVVAVVGVALLPNLGTPFAQWAVALPAVFFGIALAVEAHTGENKTGARQAIVAGLALLMPVVAWLVAWQLSETTLAGYEVAKLGTIVAAGPILLIASRLPWQTPPALESWLGTSFGVYLIHPLVGWVLITATRGSLSPLPLAIAVTILSVVATLGILKTRAGNWMV